MCNMPSISLYNHYVFLSFSYNVRIHTKFEGGGLDRQEDLFNYIVWAHNEIGSRVYLINLFWLEALEFLFYFCKKIHLIIV